MAGTRQSARLNSSSPQAAKDTAGTKRKADESSPSGNKAKRGRPSKDQKTLEETISGADNEQRKDSTEVQAEPTNDVPIESESFSLDALRVELSKLQKQASRTPQRKKKPTGL